mmetsp:Transcript_87138/g.191451  ORF Transcript_87138/g.191451 Transcript_87138/m.191451 type:complete len:106 (-) Transcript_87138:2671-2988(-)
MIIPPKNVGLPPREVLHEAQFPVLGHAVDLEMEMEIEIVMIIVMVMVTVMSPLPKSPNSHCLLARRHASLDKLAPHLQLLPLPSLLPAGPQAWTTATATAAVHLL